MWLHSYIPTGRHPQPPKNIEGKRGVLGLTETEFINPSLSEIYTVVKKKNCDIKLLATCC